MFRYILIIILSNNTTTIQCIYFLIMYLNISCYIIKKKTTLLRAGNDYCVNRNIFMIHTSYVIEVAKIV